jgi:large subunit ribosomal protein L29
MKMKEFREIKEKTVPELETRLTELKKNLLSLKFKNATGQLENVMNIHNIKKDVARIETVIRQKKV